MMEGFNRTARKSLNVVPMVVICLIRRHIYGWCDPKIISFYVVRRCAPNL